MSFNLGKPILVMVIVSLISGVFILRRPGPPQADLKVWVFADAHYKAFGALVQEYERQHGVKVEPQRRRHPRSMNVRLSSLFMTNPDSTRLPGPRRARDRHVGRFFRPPVDDVGFLPLNDRLKESGYWDDKIVRTRLAPWIERRRRSSAFRTTSTRSRSPTATTCSDEAGIDLAQAKTWPQFH